MNEEDIDTLYDYLLQYCDCDRARPRSQLCDVGLLDEGLMVDCFTGCPINSIASLFLRQAGAHLTFDDTMMMDFKHVIQD